MGNILISSAGRRVSLLRMFAAELKRTDLSAVVLASDSAPELSSACQEAAKTIRVPTINSPAFIEETLRGCQENNVTLVIPTLDTELAIYAAHKERFASHGICLAVSAPELVSACADKRLSIRFFQEHGIPVPQIIDKKHPKFPLVVKPYDGSASIGVSIVTSPTMLCQEHVDNNRLLFFEYVPKDQYDEFTVDLYYNRKGLLCCAVPRRRIEVRAGEVSKGVTEKNEIVGFLRKRLGKLEGAFGCLTFQLFKHKERAEFYAIEINPRFGGGYPLSYLAGANFPRWLIEEVMLGKEPQYYDGWEDRLLMLRYDAEVLVHGYPRGA